MQSPQHLANGLSPQQIEQYNINGCLFPVDVLSPSESSNFRNELESIEAKQGHSMDRLQCNKSYLLYDWADQLVHHPTIVDAVESLIGENILCYMTNLFTKEAGSKSFVSMHQDAAYWGVDADDVVTAWVALSPATAESGVMKVELGSHTSLREQTNTYDKDNLLSRGQEISASNVDPDKVVYMALEPGQMSLHHFKLVHGSDANTSDDRRIGLAIRYVASSAQKIGKPESALLVRGEAPAASSTSFILEQRVNNMTTRARRRQHAIALSRQIRNIYAADADTPFKERVRLFGSRLAGITVCHWKRITS